MRQIHAVKEAGFQVLLWTWGLTPLALLLLLKLAPTLCSNHPSALFAGLALWAFSALAMFGYTLHKHYRTESIESLTCTIFLGLISISLSTVSVLGSPFNLAATFSPEGDSTTLAPHHSLASDDRTLYVAAVDLSRSTIREGQERLDRLELIARTMRSIFLDGDDDSLAVSVRPKDALRIYTLSRGQAFPWNNERNGEAREDLRRGMVESLSGQLADQLNDGEAPSQKSDIMGFLSYTVCSEIQSAQGKFNRVKVILFSSWEQPGEGRRAGEEHDLNRIEECLREQQPPASILGFCLPSSLLPGGAKRCGAVAQLLRSRLPETSWEEVNLQTYDRLTAGQKVMSLEALYAHDDTPVLRIKYCPTSRTESPASSLVLPVMNPNDKAYVKLRSLSDAASPLRLDFIGYGGATFGLSLQEGEDPKPLDPRQSPLGVRLQDRLEAPRDREFELLVAIPRQSILYRVRLVIMPVFTQRAMGALFLVAMVMHLFPVPVALRIEARRRRDKRRRRQPPMPV